MDRAAFERHVAEALASIPRDFRDAMQNIAIVVEDEPSPELLEEMEIDPPDTLLGLYQGTPLTERSWAHGNTLPDRVLLFQGPHERESDDEDDLIVCDRGNADPRDRALLRHERGADRGDRGENTGRKPPTTRVIVVVRARKRFGQHFLEPAWVTKVIRAIDPVGSDAFVEIGPGRGALTRPLAAQAGHVTAVEIDRDLASDASRRCPAERHRRRRRFSRARAVSAAV